MQHAGPQTEAGRAKALEALARGRKAAIQTRKRKALLREKAKEAAKAWLRDFGHPAGPMVIALFDPEHPTHESVRLHAKQLIKIAGEGYAQ